MKTYTLSDLDIIILLQAQRDACANAIRDPKDNGAMMSMREDIHTAIGREVVLKSPLVCGGVRDITGLLSQVLGRPV